MFIFISPLIFGLSAWIFVVVTDLSKLSLDSSQWLLFLLAPVFLLSMSLKRKRSSSSLTSCLLPEIKYDAFISFRGTDTRFGFLNYLVTALEKKSINIFVDYKLRGGDEISPALLTAIEQSKLSLIVFSQDFASSSWCLEEVAQIIECMKNHNQIIIPIFYNINPSTVRHQDGIYEEAFKEHRARFDKFKLQKWQNALKKSSGICGFHSSNFKTEAELIEKVVKCVLMRLNQISDRPDLEGFVGIHERMEDVKALLCTKLQDVLVIGIWGMGGIGKTTVAEKLFEQLSYEYDSSHFMCVSRELKGGDIIQLKAKLLSKLLDEDIDNVMHNGLLSFGERRLSCKKILLVLDDVTDSDQLGTLIAKYEYFGRGSRIIITSRDKHVLVKDCNEIYEVKPLNLKEAAELFDLNAFTTNCLKNEQEYSELSNRVLRYANGVPLAIRVQGRFLYDKNKDEWESKLKKLEEVPDAKIQDILECSYNGLDDDQKGIFLFLACFFKEESKERIIMLLKACGYYPIDGLRVLQDRALITISNKRYVSMHNLIQKMGHGIVFRESPCNPSQRSHLWNPDNILEILENGMGTPTILSICLNMSRLKRDLHLGPEAFVGMCNIKLLQFESNLPNETKHMVYPPKKGFKALPNGLRSLLWDFYPLRSFPLRSPLKNLVELQFTHSCLRRLWDKAQDLPNLKIINLSYSSKLVELPDLSKAPNLQGLYLEGCDGLNDLRITKSDVKEVEDHQSSGSQVSLTSLDIEASEEHHLDLSGQRRRMNVVGPRISKPQQLNVPVLQSLQFLDLRWCPSLTLIPENIGHCLPSLHRLTLNHTNVEYLPASISYLSQLRYLSVENCKRLRSVPMLPPSIEVLHATNCRSLETLMFTSNSMPIPSQQQYDPLFMLYNCVKLGKRSKEAIARHCMLTARKILSSSNSDSYPYLCFPGREVPKCFNNYYRSIGRLLSFPLELALLSEVTGFIFYFVVEATPVIECHIEISYVRKVQFVTKVLHQSLDIGEDHVLLWHDGFLNSNIMKHVNGLKGSAPIDQCPRLYFHLSNYCPKEWGVCPMYMSMNTDFKRCVHIDEDEDDLQLRYERLYDDLRLTCKRLNNDLQQLKYEGLKDDLQLKYKRLYDDLRLMYKRLKQRPCDDLELTCKRLKDDLRLTQKRLNDDLQLTYKRLYNDPQLTYQRLDPRRYDDLKLTYERLDNDLRFTYERLCNDLQLTYQWLYNDPKLTYKRLNDDLQLTHKRLCNDLQLTYRRLYPVRHDNLQAVYKTLDRDLRHCYRSCVLDGSYKWLQIKCGLQIGEHNNDEQQILIFLKEIDTIQELCGFSGLAMYPDFMSLTEIRRHFKFLRGNSDDLARK